MDEVMVSVADESLADLPRLVADLGTAGFVLERVLRDIGAVTGSIPEECMDKLRSVAGVLQVEHQHNYRVPR